MLPRNSGPRSKWRIRIRDRRARIHSCKYGCRRFQRRGLRPPLKNNLDPVAKMEAGGAQHHWFSDNHRKEPRPTRRWKTYAECNSRRTRGSVQDAHAASGIFRKNGRIPEPDEHRARSYRRREIRYCRRVEYSNHHRRSGPRLRCGTVLSHSAARFNRSHL